MRRRGAGGGDGTGFWERAGEVELVWFSVVAQCMAVVLGRRTVAERRKLVGVAELYLWTVSEMKVAAAHPLVVAVGQLSSAKDAQMKLVDAQRANGDVIL